MLRTLAFLGIAAVAYKQLDKRGSLDRFKEEWNGRLDELRAHVDGQRAKPVNADSAYGAPQSTEAGAATI
ncbi:MAG TPA: hypothetical protein VF463_20270 [Sphingobium sp.]